MLILRDHAAEAFKLDNGVPESKEALIDLARLNLHYHTTLHSDASRVRLQTIADGIDAAKLAEGATENPYLDELKKNIDQVPVSREAKVATVALIAANIGILRECQRGFPTPHVSNLFADSECWDDVLLAVAATASHQLTETNRDEDAKTAPENEQRSAHHAKPDEPFRFTPADLNPGRTLH